MQIAEGFPSPFPEPTPEASLAFQNSGRQKTIHQRRRGNL
jgi:hypothetical protein